MNRFRSFYYFKKNAFLNKFRAIKNYYFFKRSDIKIGRNVSIIHGNGKHSFGKNFFICDNVVFEVHDQNARIITGDNCFLSYGVIVNCTVEIEMGNYVWVGEYSSLRDATHNFQPGKPMGSIGDYHAKIQIGNNVWIGRGCLILPGTVIGNDVVVAANSVVKGNLESNSMYGGAPARLIKKL